MIWRNYATVTLCRLYDIGGGKGARSTVR